jgi:hypothetical protein
MVVVADKVLVEAAYLAVEAAEFRLVEEGELLSGVEMAAPTLRVLLRAGVEVSA